MRTDRGGTDRVLRGGRADPRFPDGGPPAAAAAAGPSSVASSSSGEVTGAELGSLFSLLLARDPHNARHLVTLEPGCRHEAGHNITLL